MEITTKFNVGDTAYSFAYGDFYKFKVVKINSIELHNVYSDFANIEVEYECQAIVPDSWNCTFNKTIKQEELFTLSELKEKIEKYKAFIEEAKDGERN